MKIILNSAFKTISGKLDSIVLMAYNKVLNIAGKDVSCIARTIGLPSKIVSQKVINLRKAFKIISYQWNLLLDSDRISWCEEARVVSRNYKYNLTGYNLFHAFMLESYIATLSNYCFPISLYNPSGWHYDDRFSNKWY